MNNLEIQVKKANKDFYDIVGADYEKIDGRRTEPLTRYAAVQLKMISRNTDADSILDLGCGSGFISRVAKNYFKQRYALDISFKMIKLIDDKTLLKMTADSDLIPIKEGQFSSVVAFALLHHCYSYENMFVEIYRVLKRGGIFYSDHDMDSLFFKRFRPFLKLYRRINNTRKHYLSKISQLSENTYRCSEFHQEGIHSGKIESMLKKIGFQEVKIQYHWFGLTPLTDRIFGKRIYRSGYAPLVKIIAKK